MYNEELFNQGLKVCSNCKLTLSVDAFHRSKKTKDGLKHTCIDCEREYYKEYMKKRRRESEEVRKKENEICRKYKQEHREDIAKYNQKYKQEHPDYWVEYSKEYYDDPMHREQMRKNHEKNWPRYYAENKDRMRQYQQDNADRIREQRRQYRQTQHGKAKEHEWRDKRRALKRDAQGDYTAQDVLDILDFFDYKCAYTGEQLESSYHLDHVLALANGGSNYIYNIVPCNQRPNLSKHTHMMEEWFRKQEYFSEERLYKIYDWMSKTNKEKNEKEEDIEDVYNERQISETVN